MASTTHPSSITLRFLALPSTVNFGGNVHGGTVMSWIDQASYACAIAYAQKYCVTAFVGGIRFVRPIKIGAIVEVEARLAFTGRTSMNIAVDVRSGDLKDGALQTNTECAVVMVAVDAEGKATEVQALLPEGAAGTALAEETRRRLGAANAPSA